MRRRTLIGSVAALSGCSILPARPYLEKREWPLDMARPASLPPPSGAKVLLVRTLRAAPGMEARGLQVLQDDGSIRTDFYEEWSVPPADAIEDVLRRWLGASGLFSVVLAPGSRLRADFAVEGELLTLLAKPVEATTRAALGIVLLDLRPTGTPRIVLQTEAAVSLPIQGRGPPSIARSGQTAVSALMTVVEARIRAALPP